MMLLGTEISGPGTLLMVVQTVETLPGKTQVQSLRH